MERNATNYLDQWKKRPDRKPLVVRGTRQVGKTFLIEGFGRKRFRSCATVDLELWDQLHSLFKIKDPLKIIEELSLFSGLSEDIVPGETLLFLDEIQACPEALACLRYFRERLPELHVIAAGSLLDFHLREFHHSMPVGRIEFLNLYPMTFEEFLLANGESRLVEYLNRYHIGEEFSVTVHTDLCKLLRKYLFVGGMPEAVRGYAENHQPRQTQRIQSEIVTTLEGDFAKYGTRAQQRNMARILKYIPKNVGRKFKYVGVSREIQSKDLKTALELLERSRLVHLIHHSSANGIPLGAEASETRFKPLFLDIGLISNVAGLELVESDGLITVMEGQLAEQYIGQEMLALGLPFEDRRLYYWHREEKNANAEVDYLFSLGEEIFPIEVKAGKTGSLKSLHLFLAEKGRRRGVRFNMDKPALGHVQHPVRFRHKQLDLSYSLLSLPLYLSGQLNRLLSEWEPRPHH